MNTEKSNCPFRDDHFPSELLDRQIDRRIRQVFRSLRLNKEDLALGLAARLRVLGKSLAAGCREGDQAADRQAHAYKALRLQLDEFMRSLVERGFAGHPAFSALHEYLRGSLPFEAGTCSGTVCRLELIDTAIALLSEGGWEKDGLEAPALSDFSLKCE